MSHLKHWQRDSQISEFRYKSKRGGNQCMSWLCSTMKRPEKSK